MAVKYVAIDNERVSTEWYAVLSQMRLDGVSFNVNEGKRTMARQWFFYNGYKRGAPGFNLAAFPSPTAPHIRVGRIDHAIDVTNGDGVVAWLRKNGLNASRPVPGENWHVEVPASDLRAYAAKHPAFRVIKKGVSGPDVKRLQVYLRGAGYLRDSWKVHNKYTLTVRRAVRKFQSHKRMKVDGIVGPATLKALRKEYNRRTK